MPLPTTCIGAWPKPACVALPDWFGGTEGPDTADPTARWAEAFAALGDEAEAVLERGVAEAIADQVAAGIDVPTDGEISRENYIHYHCRHLDGFDFAHLGERAVRGGTYRARLPAVVGPVRAREPFLVRDWQRAQRCTDRAVKMTMPGPMTVTDTNVDRFYGDPQALGAAIADALNVEVLALAEAGCRHVQIDEPLFARRPGDALAFGFEHLERAFHRCPTTVVRTVHMCCGYPDALDRESYPKADPGAYARLADAIEGSVIDAVSLEAAHRPLDLAVLERLPTTHVILGVVAIARSRIETVEEIERHLRLALEHVDPERLVAAPDCGLGLLGRERAVAKLRNLCAAAARVGRR